MTENLQKLTMLAKNKMSQSNDPVHDVSHAKRVVKFTQKIASQTKLNKTQYNALILAAWWHDVGRTITSKPSIIWMPFIDDLLSGFMLIKEQFLNLIWCKEARLATRVVICKSLGTGAILTKFLLTKKDSVLVDIVEDADKLDIFSIERTEHLQQMVEQSHVYHLGYRTTIWWYLSTRQLQLKTRTAMEFLKKTLTNFIRWLKQASVFYWHVSQFGYKWVHKNIMKAEYLLFKLAKSC